LHESSRVFYRANRHQFPIRLTVEDVIAEGDYVAVRYSERGSFTGPFLGHEPTGKFYELVGMEWFVIRDGTIRRRWGARDSASQARQIGLPPG
jgi:predicted ester cyclase